MIRNNLFSFWLNTIIHVVHNQFADILVEAVGSFQVSNLSTINNNFQSFSQFINQKVY